MLDANFNNYGDLEEHIEVVHDGKSLLECKTCDANFTNYGDLDEHVEFRHGGNTLPEWVTMLKCQVCSAEYEDQKTLKTQDSSKGFTWIEKTGMNFELDWTMF